MCLVSPGLAEDSVQNSQVLTALHCFGTRPKDLPSLPLLPPILQVPIFSYPSTSTFSVSSSPALLSSHSLLSVYHPAPGPIFSCSYTSSTFSFSSSPALLSSHSLLSVFHPPSPHFLLSLYFHILFLIFPLLLFLPTLSFPFFRAVCS